MTFVSFTFMFITTNFGQITKMVYRRHVSNTRKTCVTARGIPPVLYPVHGWRRGGYSCPGPIWGRGTLCLGSVWRGEGYPCPGPVWGYPCAGRFRGMGTTVLGPDWGTPCHLPTSTERYWDQRPGSTSLYPPHLPPQDLGQDFRRDQWQECELPQPPEKDQGPVSRVASPNPPPVNWQSKNITFPILRMRAVPKPPTPLVSIASIFGGRLTFWLNLHWVENFIGLVWRLRYTDSTVLVS